MDSGQVEGSTTVQGAARGLVGDRGVTAEKRFRAVVLPVDASETCREAREMVAVTLRSWGLGHLVDDLRSCVSELVGNVQVHAIPENRTPLRPPMVTVALRWWPGWLFLDVEDEDPMPPILPQGETFGPDLAADLPEALLPTNGRGLDIVRRLADHLWWAPDEEKSGKHVVCRFALAEPSTPDRGLSGVA